MYKSRWILCAMTVTWLSGTGITQAAEPTMSRQRVQLPPVGSIYGSQLMSEQERAEHRTKMQSAQSTEEQAQIRQEHHEQMKLRAASRGVTLPEEPPARCQGMRAGRSCALMPASERLAAAEIAWPRSQNANGIAYASGGIGEDDPVARMSEHYNLHIIFAAKGNGEYLADIRVVVENSKGARVLEAESTGPIFYAKLPSGQYRITADYQGTALRKSVFVKDGRLQDLYFYWPINDTSDLEKRS